MRVAVVGHVEWAECVEVERVPRAGEIVHAKPAWDAPAGGGAVAAVQLARLAGECLFITALGDDELGHRCERELGELGVRVAAAWREEPQRRAFVFLSADGERTITVVGDRMGPKGDDDLPWDDLAGMDAVYFTAGDVGAVKAARAARQLVATVRARDALAAAGVQIDMLVASVEDEGERYTPGEIEPPPAHVALTNGAAGGTLTDAGGTSSHWSAAPLPARVVDTYGSGDSFAAGLTYGLAEGRSPADAAAVGARCGAACATGCGPYAARVADPSPAPSG